MLYYCITVLLRSGCRRTTPPWTSLRVAEAGSSRTRRRPRWSRGWAPAPPWGPGAASPAPPSPPPSPAWTRRAGRGRTRARTWGRGRGRPGSSRAWGGSRQTQRSSPTGDTITWTLGQWTCPAWTLTPRLQLNVSQLSTFPTSDTRTACSSSARAAARSATTSCPSHPTGRSCTRR